MLAIERVASLATIQDLGRPGLLSSGVGRSGAADRGALRLGNRLVGNPEDAAGIEVVLGGMGLRALRPLTCAVTGAPVPTLLGDRMVGPASVVRVSAGQTLRLGVGSTGLRCYVAVRGGIAVPPVLGSRSFDSLARLGPRPLQAGDVVPVGPPPDDWPLIEQAPQSGPAEKLRLPVIFGPRDDWFANPLALCADWWRVSADADRVGVRLELVTGAPLRRLIARELPTEPMPLGAIQVPPSGQPVVFLADHPVTGGYPVIAVLRADAVDCLAQARPGQLLRFQA